MSEAIERQVERPARAGPRLARRLGPLWSWAVFAAVFLGLWELGARAYDQPYLLPAPTSIVREFMENTQVVLAFTWITFQEISVGFVLGAAAALLVAMLLVWLPPLLEEFLFRLTVTLNSTPFVALASLVVVWFGIGIRSKVVSAALFTFFAVLYHVHKEFVSVETTREHLMDVYNANWWQRMLLLRVPSALPITFTSLKGGVMAAVNGAIVGELFGAFEGLGFMILDSRYVGNTVRVFLAAVMSALIGWVLLGVVTAAERVLLPWHVVLDKRRER